MSVALDANATSSTATGGATTLDNGNLTIGSGSNRVLIAFLHLSILQESGSNPSVVWDPAGANQSMFKIAARDNALGSSVSVWGLVAPASGNKIIRASWTGTAQGFLSGTSFTGADQTGGTTTFAHGNVAEGSATTVAVVITSAVGNIAIGGLTVPYQDFDTPTQTQLYYNNANDIVGAAAYGAGAASVSIGWSIIGGDQAYSMVGCDIVAATVVTPSVNLIYRARQTA